MKFEDVKINDKLILNEEAMKESRKPFILGWVDYMRAQKEIVITDIDDGILIVNGSQDYGISEESIKCFNKIESDVLKIEDLKVGDELECIDRDGFIDGECSHSNEKILGNPIIISHFGAYGAYLTVEYWLEESELKYFKKKEPVKEYDFNDLIDVAVQAKKDGIIKNVFLGSEHIDFDYGEEEYAYTTKDISNGINFIQSIYKETFVIESMRDAERMSVGAMITLNNGEIVFYSGIDTNLIYVDSEDRDSIGLPFFVLKGATVEQDK